MRVWLLASIALGFGVANGFADAPVRTAAPADLDAIADAAARLAAAAGACAPGAGRASPRATS